MSTGALARRGHSRARRRAVWHHAAVVPLLVVALVTWGWLRLSFAWSSRCHGWALDLSRASVLLLAIPIGLSIWLVVGLWRDIVLEGRERTGLTASTRACVSAGWAAAPRATKRHVRVATASGVSAIVGIAILLAWLWLALSFRAF